VFLAAGLPVSQSDETPAPKQRGAADHNHGEQDRTGSRQVSESTHSKVPNFTTRFMMLCDSTLMMLFDNILIMLRYSIALTLALRTVRIEQLF
jgi:hypothetical protein